MVHKGISKPEEGKGKIVIINPTELSELKDEKYDKFIIKFGSESCPPCRLLDEFLKEDFTLKKDVHIFRIQLVPNNQSKIYLLLSDKFSFSSIPYCVVTDKSLKMLDSILGFNKEKFTEFVTRNFN